MFMLDDKRLLIRDSMTSVRWRPSPCADLQAERRLAICERCCMDNDESWKSQEMRCKVVWSQFCLPIARARVVDMIGRLDVGQGN